MSNHQAYVEVSVKKWIPELQRYADSEEQIQLIHNVTTNKLRDNLSDRLYTRTTNDGGRGAGFIALSTGSVTPTAADTTIENETSASGLARVDATTKTHTTGTNTTTISHQFTAGAGATIKKAGLLTASSAGDLYHAALFASDAVLAINDLLTVTFTITHA